MKEKLYVSPMVAEIECLPQELLCGSTQNGTVEGFDFEDWDVMYSMQTFNMTNI